MSAPRLAGICDPPEVFREVHEGLDREGDGMADRIQDMVASINCRLQKFGGAAVYYRDANGKVIDPCATPQWSALGDTTPAPGVLDSVQSSLPTFLTGAIVGGLVGGALAWWGCKSVASSLIKSNKKRR